MASSDPYRARSSYRRNNSSTWRNNGFEAFSRSSRDEEDDEEALKWGALQKLPTYERLRKGILTNSHSKASEIDVSNLGLQERKELMERLFKVAEADNENFLLKLKNRIDRQDLILSSPISFTFLKANKERFSGYSCQILW